VQHLACNVYHWGRGPADRLLAECVAPAVRDLRRAGLAERFWFQRFDARGPHLFLLAGTAPGRAEALREALGARLDAWLAAHPSEEPLTDDELRTRHDQCRGKRLCALDAEPGIAPNNSVRWAPHAPDAYPLSLSAGAAAHDALWGLLSALAEWNLGRLGDAGGAAVRWMAAVDAELRRAHPAAEGYWRRHAGTLLLGLEERLAADAGAVLDALPRVVGARNAETFGRVWDAVEGGEAVWEPLPQLLRMMLADDGRPLDVRLHMLREINHVVLGQLGQPVAAHVPLVLFAWLRGLAPAAAR
jgi:hypothetical protein